MKNSFGKEIREKLSTVEPIGSITFETVGDAHLFLDDSGDICLDIGDKDYRYLVIFSKKNGEVVDARIATIGDENAVTFIPFTRYDEFAKFVSGLYQDELARQAA